MGKFGRIILGKIQGKWQENRIRGKMKQYANDKDD